MKPTINNQQRVLLKLISNLVFSSKADISDAELDVRELFLEAKHQAVIPIAFEGCVLHGIEIDSAVYMEYFTKSAKITAKNQKLLSVQERCKTVLTEADVPFTVIKGSAVSAMYENPDIRSMGDVDILVSSPDVFDRAVDALTSGGFTYKGGEGEIHREFSLDGCVVELHFEINGIPNGENGNKIRQLLKENVHNTEICEMNGYSFPVPCPTIHGMILLLHMYEHLQTGGIGLRHLCDWGVFARKYLDNSDSCKRMLEVYEGISILKFCKIVTDAAKRCFEIPFEFEWCRDVDVDVVSQLIFDIFDGGNFGYKNPQDRYMSDILVKRKDEENKNIVKRGFSNFKERANTSMPITKKYPIMLAFAPFYMPVRYIYRVLTGKRKKVNAVKMVQKSSKRRALYDKFEMFR